MPGEERATRERPWVFRTYSGHSSAEASNALYRTNLAKGQTGLSVAFDLPTQTGYDSDHPLARGEVGKVGVPIGHVEDMEMLFRGIPLDRMNTSMTINATAAWLLALYVAAAERQGVAASQLSGTTQNDIVKEYLSRGTYVFPPEPSIRLISDMIAFTVHQVPKWNPINICSYHLQEAGATPVQEIAFSISNAISVLDAVRDSGKIDPAHFPKVVGRISFFVNAGVRFIEEMCKMRAFVKIWGELTGERYGVTDAKYRMLRYGVQVNSLGLTERQPENNIARIIYEMIAVTLSKDARARAIQLPAWNEALGLPRPWDQQLSTFCKHLGVAYQIQNDLKDMEENITNKKAACGDILKGRPTLLFALALEAANEDERVVLLQAAREGPSEEAVPKIEKLKEIYFKHEIPLQAAMLADQQRARALKSVERVPHEGLQALFTFLTATLLE